jgi:hypothetical protein
MIEDFIFAMHGLNLSVPWEFISKYNIIFETTYRNGIWEPDITMDNMKRSGSSLYIGIKR